MPESKLVAAIARYELNRHGTTVTLNIGLLSFGEALGMLVQFYLEKRRASHQEIADDLAAELLQQRMNATQEARESEQRA